MSVTRRSVLRLAGLRLAAVPLLAAAGLIAALPARADGEVNIYSYRQEVLIRPLLDKFTERTGIKVNVVFAKKGMIERLKAEGDQGPADVVLTVDVARLIKTREAGVLQPVKSAVLEANVPPQFRDPDGYWYGLTMRARPIIYNPDKVKPSDLSTYEGLADAKWKGRICIRSSSNVYNQSLIASLIAANGKDATLTWAKAFTANFARKPQGGDRDQIRAVAAGECDVAVVNHYYYAGMLVSKKEKDVEVARKLKIFWPNQDGRGTHVNISGAAVAKSSKNKANAVKLLEFLSSEEAQKIYAEKVREYPVKPGVEAAAGVMALGEFKRDDQNLADLARHNANGVRIADRAGWR